MICDKIAASLAPDCSNPLLPGVVDKLWIINFDDVASMPRNVTNDEIIEDIILNSGTTAFTIEGKNYSNKASYEIVEEEFVNNVMHKVDILVFNDGGDVRKEVNAMNGGRFLIVTQNNFEGAAGEAAFNVYGTENGLRLREGGQDKGDKGNLGAHRLTFKSSDQAPEPKVPNAFYDTSVAVTKAILVALE